MAQVLVHGEQNEMMRLKAALLREYEDIDESISVHSPAIGQNVELHFRGEKMAKVDRSPHSLSNIPTMHALIQVAIVNMQVVGELATKKPTHGQVLSGVLVKRNFAYHIMTPEDTASELDLHSVRYYHQLDVLPTSITCSSCHLTIAGYIFAQTTIYPNRKTL